MNLSRNAVSFRSCGPVGTMVPRTRPNPVVIRVCERGARIDGESASGSWILRMRDARLGISSGFRNFSLSLIAPTAP